MINTLEELKLLLNIENDLQDDLLNLELELTEDFITAITHNYFFVNNLYLKDLLVFDEINNTITTTQNKLNYFLPGQQIRIIGTNLNDNIYTITEITNGVFKVNGIIENEETELLSLIQVIKYPKSLKLIQAEMVKFNLLTAEKTGIKQESISRHSITYQTDINNAYPSFILNKLKAFNNISF